MEFWNDVSETLSDVAGKTKKVAEDVAEGAKLQYKIRSLSSKIRQAYRRIGETVYGTYLSGSDETEEIHAVCAEIDAWKEQIKEASAKYAKLRGNKICTQCGKSLTKGAKFCSFCGAVCQEDDDDVDDDIDVDIVTYED